MDGNGGAVSMYIEHKSHIQLGGAYIPLDDANADYRQFKAWRDAGNVPATPAPAPVSARLAALDAGVQANLDAQAQALGYVSLERAAGYGDEPAVPKFQAEGRALREWRSLVWAACYQMLEQWQGGNLPEPTLGELMDKLPQFKAPG